jgi:4-hydroxy-2-oxoheptanedioate aldolase
MPCLNPLKQKLARGELTASMTVRLVSSVEIVRIAKTAGFDAIYVDLEHSAFSIETTCQLSVMALEAGIPALVRVPARTPEYISRVLDGGAFGVIAPGVGAAEEAKEVVAAAKYPPLGSRGLSTGLAHLGFRGLSSRPDLVQKFVAMGARFVSTGTDLGFLLAACIERAKQVRTLKT